MFFHPFLFAMSFEMVANLGLFHPFPLSLNPADVNAYSKTCLKWPLKKNTKNCFLKPIIA